MVMEKFVVDINHVPNIETRIAACIGYFDGIHLGHRQLIDETIKQAHSRGIKSAMITFHPDPWVVIKNIKKVEHLTTMKDRMDFVESLGIDVWIILNFTKELSECSPQMFLEDILCKLPIDALIFGYDFRFGHRGLGDGKFLKEEGKHCFESIEIDQISDDDKKISSTRISEAITTGDMETAARLLDRPYSISGIVVGGRHKGREIGFPTANLDYPQEYILPKIGVYIGEAEVPQGRFKAMINIGHNPTFNTRTEISIEAYLLDFNDILYGQKITLFFLHRIRDEMKFANVQILIEQMLQDYQTTREYFDSK
jgi:riboflavin kinase / FMN adenylyltransferase